MHTLHLLSKLNGRVCCFAGIRFLCPLFGNISIGPDYLYSAAQGLHCWGSTSWRLESRWSLEVTQAAHSMPSFLHDIIASCPEVCFRFVTKEQRSSSTHSRPKAKLKIAPNVQVTFEFRVSLCGSCVLWLEHFLCAICMDRGRTFRKQRTNQCSSCSRSSEAWVDWWLWSWILAAYQTSTPQVGNVGERSALSITVTSGDLWKLRQSILCGLAPTQSSTDSSNDPRMPQNRRRERERERETERESEWERERKQKW